jgi:hypothetical protein
MIVKSSDGLTSDIEATFECYSIAAKPQMPVRYTNRIAHYTLRESFEQVIFTLLVLNLKLSLHKEWREMQKKIIA